MKNLFSYEHIESLLSKHNDKYLELAIVYIERLVACLALMSGSLVIMKFSKVISPYPTMAILIGAVLLVASFALIIWVAIGAWWKVINTFGAKYITCASGAFFIVISSFFVTAGAYGAFLALPK